jgi:hypothetical protein
MAADRAWPRRLSGENQDSKKRLETLHVKLPAISFKIVLAERVP